MGIGRRGSDRIRFELGYGAHIMAIDGTWQRRCLVDDVSATGAKHTVLDAFSGLKLDEFFLLLSTVGKVHRRCKLAWVSGDTLGVSFLSAKPERPRRRPGPGASDRSDDVAAHDDD